MDSVKIIKGKKHISIAHVLAVAVTIIIIVLMQVSYAQAATDPSRSVTDYYTEVSGNRISVMDVNSRKYLFLPSEADISDIQLLSANDEQTVQFLEQSSTFQNLDLSGILPEDPYITSVQVINNGGTVDESFSLTIMQGSGAGSLYFNSSDPIDHGRAWIDRSKDNRTSGTAVVTDKDGIVLNQGEKKQVVEELHGRGYTSWNDPKKSYQIKFDKKVSFMDGAAEAKKWILLAQYKDPLRMSDKIIKDIANEVSDRFSPREIWVNLYYDGEYRGLYLLSEKIEVKPGRVDITDMEEYYKSLDETYGDNTSLTVESNKYGLPYQYQNGLADPEQYGGYLLEMNRPSWDDNNGFEATTGIATLGINIKSPELGGRRSVKYISEYFQEFVDAVCGYSYGGKNPNTGLYYYDYCDLDSLVDAYLLQCISSELDSFSRSQFFYKEADSKMIAGPVWDMDLSFGTGWSNEEPPERDYLAGRPFTSDLIRIPGFHKKVQERYMDVYSGILARLADSGEAIGSFSNYYSMISESLAMDTVIWPTKYKCGDGSKRWDDNASLETVLDYRVNWITLHKNFLDRYFQNEDAGGVIIPGPDSGGGSEPAIISGTDPDAEQVAKLIGKINIEDPDETTVAEARMAYDKLSDEAKAQITSDEISILEAAEKRIQELHELAEAEAKKEVGAVSTIGAGTVTVTSKENKTVAFKSADSSKRSITVPATVKISGDIFKVTEIKTGAFRQSAATTVTISKNIKKIGKKAFIRSKVTKLIVKTTKLTKKSVKDSLKGSKVRTVQVKVGSKSLNKKYLKKYKKIFTKANAGCKAILK